MVAKEEQGHEDIWTKLVGRANEDIIFINGQPVTVFWTLGARLPMLVRIIAWLMVSTLIQ